jgi:hypothetical protein
VEKGFSTPSKNIFCGMQERELRCDMVNTKDSPTQKCDSGTARSFGMMASGKSARYCASDFVGDSSILEYGKTWDYQGFHCKSESSGLTCTNKSRHGWMLKWNEQRLF